MGILEKPRTVVLEGERPTSWNAYYSGSHWSQRHAEAKRVHMLIRAYIDPDDPMFTCRVDIQTIVYFDKQPLDPCNITDKLFIDGFIGWWIKDDDRRYVRTVSTRSELDKENPRVEITFTPVDEEDN